MTQAEFQERYSFDLNRDCLGRGGFGAVYRAHDTLRGRDVAIKIAEVKDEHIRLKKEVDIAKSIPEHRNIAFYEDCHTIYMPTGYYDIAIMQYYEAGSLEQILQHEQLNLEQRCDILLQTLNGIDFLHSHDIIHRDLKPQNILVDRYKEKLTIKITDFGISKHLDGGENSFVSNSIVGAGTLSYASPEQLAERSIRRNTDLWSFGVLAFRILTGTLPFTTGNYSPSSEQGRGEIMRQITSGTLPPTIANVPQPWRRVIEECLNTDNNQRVQSAKECLEHLADYKASSDVQYVNVAMGERVHDTDNIDESANTILEASDNVIKADVSDQKRDERDESGAMKENRVHDTDNIDESANTILEAGDNVIKADVSDQKRDEKDERDESGAMKENRVHATHLFTRILYSVMTVVIGFIFAIDLLEYRYICTIIEVCYSIGIWGLAAYLSIFVRKAPIYAHFAALYAAATYICIYDKVIFVLGLGILTLIYAIIAIIKGWIAHRGQTNLKKSKI